ncbi:MAG: cysteine hydrolase [Oscillospiraceae bacterium]|jgi:nicotinamidase-related amidase|nr:cysteine hydrolase [Oscillospiraceae bacterium]
MDRQITVPTWYYQHFGADYTLDVPAEGFGGWKKADLPLSKAHTALCVMHAWDCPDRARLPGLYSAVEYLPRAEEILRIRIPSLLKAFRDAGIHVIHVEDGDYLRKYEQYRRTLKTIKLPREKKLPRPAQDTTYKALSAFRTAHVHPGAENLEDIAAAGRIRDIHPGARPTPGEYMVTETDELQAVCALHGINHLIYAGFAVNYCLLMSSAGMLDMSRRGFLCSVVKDATTAVECGFSAKEEMAKQLALWNAALSFGFVYEQEDLERSLV